LKPRVSTDQQSATTRGTGATVLRVLGVLAAVVLAPWALLGFHLDVFGEPAVGVVTGKHEAITLHTDSWRRDWRVEYRYRVRETGQDLDASQSVGADLYAQLAVGERVPVRYSPWPLLRSLGSAGCTLAAAPWTSRLPRWSDQVQFLVEIGLVGGTVWLAYVAWRRRSWRLGLVAITAVATVGAGVLLFGFLIFPLLLLAWWRRPGRGLGTVLLVSVLLSTLILAWRVPWPPAEPAAPRASALASVRQLQEVHRVWGTARQSGQLVRRPYALVDLEFTPPGAHEPLHALDAVDLGSVPGLTVGATLPVVYATAEPHQARLQAGTRGYARDLLNYILLLSFGTGAALLLLGYPIVKLLGGASRRFKDLTRRDQSM
jgi:hypothetical protein